jgi:hypothetical protein
MMIENSKPTIEEVSDLFIPKQFREYFEITAITPTEIFLNTKKLDTPENKAFLEQFMQITKMIGIKVSIQS